MDNFRFVYQNDMYRGSCEPCTVSIFLKWIRSNDVNWKIDMRQAVLQAVKKGLPLEKFTCNNNFQKWCIKQQNSTHSGKEFTQLATAEKLLKWVETLKTSLPDFIYAVREFGLMPRLDKDGNPQKDAEGNPILYRRRKQENVKHLSGLFMSDYDHLPFDPRELYEKTKAPGYPWKTRLAHITSSGEGLRLVSECLLNAGNIADQQYLQAKELGMLNVIGTTGKHVTDNSCINCDKLSFCPREKDILMIDEDKLFNF